MTVRLALLVFCLLTIGWFAPAATPASHAQEPAQPSVLFTRVDDTITPVVAEHLVVAVDAAAAGDHGALVVELDTPGGLDSSMREIVSSFLGARVPVVVHIAPAGARGASAGAFITFAGHVAAMAPGTTIGAATPVDLQGGESSDKVVNDAVAYARSIAQQRGRNADFAEATVRDGKAVPAGEAAEIGAVDLVVPDRAELLTSIDGREVTVAGGTEVVLRTAGARVVEYEMGLFSRLRQLLANPDLAFLFLSLGTLAILYEVASPGGVLGGVAGVILLVLGFVALSVLPVNTAGLILLALAAGLFVAEVLAPGVGVFAVGGAVALLLAGLFLYEGPFAVNPAVLWPVVVIVGAGSVLAGRLALRARKALPITGQEGLVGEQAEVTDVRVDSGGSEGRALVEGAWWQVRSRAPLEHGQRVRVVGLDELTLLVEPVREKEDHE